MKSFVRFQLLLPLLAALAFAPAVRAEAPARVRIKNGHGITVALGKTREAATGIRPEKKTWVLELDPSFVGAEADLRDVTPDVAGARWSVPVTTARLVLDAARFLPGHVYRLELRRERHTHLYRHVFGCRLGYRRGQRPAGGGRRGPHRAGPGDGLGAELYAGLAAGRGGSHDAGQRARPGR